MATDKYIDAGPDPNSCYLQKFKLYETRSNFYLIGRDKSRTCWRILKINRLEPSELIIFEDSATYSQMECFDLLSRVHEGNISTGGLKFVTSCYGIVGFIKFLGPYYMLLITKRRKIGAICGHTIYGISKSLMIQVPHSSVECSMANSKDEKRYKKLLCSVDLTKDFFFSYSYNVMHTLQKNLCNNGTRQFHYEAMFVWNEYMSRGIRNNLKNTLWTVALVHGFFNQVKLSVKSGKVFNFTLIARRSRHYAGTRYLKRGVNEKGRVANDVETEQIVCEDVPDGSSVQISSVVQNRGSIPLFWSQDTSRLNIKPDIRLSKKDENYEATRLHFENLVKRYGNPIIILNLIKTREKKPRETILRAEFANAIRVVNKGLPKEKRLRFLHWDLQKHAKRATDALSRLGRVATLALNETGFFYCQVTPNPNPERFLNFSSVEKIIDDCPIQNLSDKIEDAGDLDTEGSKDSYESSANPCIRVSKLQKGVLRTNCIDCLDRTNVAQYTYGLVALGHQLYRLGLVESPTICLDDYLAENLMKIYETMGDTLALQYGGSAAHNKIFCERRGQWKAATHSQEFFRTLQRFYSNTYIDAEKQDAINVFLGHFQPQLGKPALWELNSDQHHNVGRHNPNMVDDMFGSIFKRSFSDGNIVCETTPSLSEKALAGDKGLSDSNPEITTGGTEISYSRYSPLVSRKQRSRDMEDDDEWLESDHICYDKHGEACNCTNFLDLDWLSSSEEDIFDRSVTNESSSSMKTESAGTELVQRREQTGSAETELGCDGLHCGFDESFVDWVTHGEMLFR